MHRVALNEPSHNSRLKILSSLMYWSVSFAVLTLFTGSQPIAFAHEPKLHGFDLTSFEKPFAAPDITLTDIDGASQQLIQLRGKVVLLNFWATWCPPCLEEMPSMQTLYDKFANDDFTIVAVSSDKEGKSIVSPFLEQLNIQFPVWLDPTGEVAKKYGATNLPVSFLINKEGLVIAAATGQRDWSSNEALSTVDELVRNE